MGTIIFPSLEQMNTEILQEFPDYRVYYKKDSTLMKVINVCLLVVTFGKLNAFLTKFITTLGTTVYVPASWNTMTVGAKCTVLRHERIHMRQSKKMGRLLYSLKYLFWPLPLGWAAGRTEIEMEAYTETLRAWRDYGANIKQTGLRQDMIDHFISAEYGWMCPSTKKVSEWYDRTADQILAEHKDED